MSQSDADQQVGLLINVFRQDGDDQETAIARENASIALARMGSVALPQLLGALKEERSTVRQGVIDALGQLQDPRTVPSLIQMLQDENEEVRQAAVNALGQIGDQRALEPLISQLKDEDHAVRAQVCWALGDIGGVKVVDPLTVALSDPDPFVRCEAITNVGRIWGVPIPRDVPDPEPEERRVAIENQVKSTYGEYILDFLLAALNDPVGKVRASAVITLGQIAEKRSLPALLWAQQNDPGYDDTNEIQRFIAWAIQRIQERSQKS